MTKSLQELLLSIATGGPQRARVHRGYALVEVNGRRERDKVEVESQPGEHPGLWSELQTTIARLSRMGAPTGAVGRPAESAVPYHNRAAAVAARLGNEVSTWARAMAEEYPHLTLTAATIPSAARWLATFPTLLAEHPAAAEMYSGILQVVRAAERVIDRAPDRIYVGPCDDPCPGQLYAKRDTDDEDDQAAAFVRCRECGTRHDVAVRREWLERQLDDQLDTAANIAPAVAWITANDKVTANTIRNWKWTGQLATHGEDRKGYPLYRIGEVIALSREMKARREQGKRRRRGSAA